ncbi:flagellar basal body-associated FliL family protein [Thioclava sp. GXIMD2076]|uniref:Flagellar protein FliL n=1 Tax=Thioclava kandeliae TaxID=3070818 RepID=A0ABV1SEC8_9RHOB
MAEATADQIEGSEEPKKKSKLPLIIGLVLMLVFGGGSFFALYSGMILAPPAAEDPHAEEVPKPADLPDISFIKLDPMVISLSDSASRHLRFSAELEVPTAYQADVEKLRPRVMDVLNGYLRAVDLSELEDRTALIKLRAQMLRRIQIVTGEGRVNDLLIIEFVLN